MEIRIILYAVNSKMIQARQLRSTLDLHTSTHM